MTRLSPPGPTASPSKLQFYNQATGQAGPASFEAMIILHGPDHESHLVLQARRASLLLHNVSLHDNGLGTVETANGTRAFVLGWSGSQYGAITIGLFYMADLSWVSELEAVTRMGPWKCVSTRQPSLVPTEFDDLFRQTDRPTSSFSPDMMAALEDVATDPEIRARLGL
jgi:hypothetical protein